MGFKRCLACCACLILLVALAGCGASGGQAAGENQAGKASATNGGLAAAARSVVKSIEVKETEYKLNPAEITLNKPGAYVFEAENTGSTTHALEIKGKGVEEERSAPRGPLAKAVRRLDEPAQGAADALAEAVAEAVAEADADAVVEADAGFGRIRLAP